MENFRTLVKIVEQLRSPDGCPWDKEQTLYSVKNQFIEEAFELLDALDRQDIENIKEELGDVLFHTVFHSVVAESEGLFNLDDVLENVSEKLVRRHPHVFGDKEVADSAEVLVNWDKIKQQEKGKKDKESVLDDVPAAYPSIMRALKMQQKARKSGFDWEKPEDCMDKVREEFNEFEEAVRDGSHDEIEHELGDMFFALINMSRFLKVNPDEALRKANNRFESRFRYVEKSLKDKGSSCEQSTLEEMDKYWDEAKKIEKEL